MRNETRILYSRMLSNMARAYGVNTVTQSFAVSIPMETKINDKIRESLAFLQAITMSAVTDSKGQALELGVSGLLAKRTNTANNDRTPTTLGGPDGTAWEVALTEFDVAIGYQLLDQWARYPDFYQRYMNAVFHKIALDRLTIGWYGESVAAETAPATYPLGQDVNIGWLKLLADNNSGNFMTEGATAGSIIIGSAAGADYKNVDALAFDLYAGIPVEHRTGKEVVLVGSSLIADDQNKVATQNAHTPTEKKQGLATLANSYGGLPALTPPKFPDTGMMITDPANLHLYYQEGKTRRNTEEESKRNRVVDYISSNDAYAIGNLKGVVAIEAANVVINNG